MPGQFLFDSRWREVIKLTLWRLSGRFAPSRFMLFNLTHKVKSNYFFADFFRRSSASMN